MDSPRVGYAVGNEKVDNNIHLGAALVKIDNIYHHAIVDLNDPSGIQLMNLYDGNNNVWFAPIMWRRQEMNAAISINISNSMANYNRIVKNWDPQSHRVSIVIPFPAPHRSQWKKLTLLHDLKIYHGLGHDCTLLSPTDDNIHLIGIYGAPCMLCPISTMV